MSYVMVPVPEEHVAEVLRHVVRLIEHGGPIGEDGLPWDEESIARLFAESDEPARSLLSLLALPANAGQELRAKDVATELELRSADLAGIMGPLSRRAKGMGRLSPIRSRRTVVETNGVRRTFRSLSLAVDLAAMVRTAERALLQHEADTP